MYDHEDGGRLLQRDVHVALEVGLLQQLRLRRARSLCGGRLPLLGLCLCLLGGDGGGVLSGGLGAISLLTFVG